VVLVCSVTVPFVTGMIQNHSLPTYSSFQKLPVTGFSVRRDAWQEKPVVPNAHVGRVNTVRRKMYPQSRLTIFISIMSARSIFHENRIKFNLIEITVNYVK
jgi:hypothetical protein